MVCFFVGVAVVVVFVAVIVVVVAVVLIICFAILFFISHLVRLVWLLLSSVKLVDILLKFLCACRLGSWSKAGDVLSFSLYSILGKNGKVRIASSLITNSMRVALVRLHHSVGAVPLGAILAPSACHCER